MGKGADLIGLIQTLNDAGVLVAIILLLAGLWLRHIYQKYGHLFELIEKSCAAQIDVALDPDDKDRERVITLADIRDEVRKRNAIIDGLAKQNCPTIGEVHKTQEEIKDLFRRYVEEAKQSREEMHKRLDQLFDQNLGFRDDILAGALDVLRNVRANGQTKGRDPA